MKSLLDFIKPKKVSQKLENIEGIDFKFRKNPLSRYVKITLQGENKVLVSLPKRAPFSYARDFAIKNIDEIKAAIEKNKNKNYFFDGVEYPSREDLIFAVRKKAKQVLPKKLCEVANKYGYKYNKLSLKLMKTRWGSCSYRNNINLNISLVTLEDELIEYVLLHELVHTVEKNHSSSFWARLLMHMPDARYRQKILKSRKVI